MLDVLEKPSEAFLDLEKDLGVQARYYRYAAVAIRGFLRVSLNSPDHSTSVTDPDGLPQVFDSVVEDFGRIDSW